MAHRSVMTIDQCRIIELPLNEDARGSLIVAESMRQIPFDLKRIFCIYGVPAGAERGGHALKTCEQLLVAVSGSLDVVVSDGTSSKRYHLDRPGTALYIPPRIWREMDNFSGSCVCLALASTLYDASDYYREYDDFIRSMNEPGA